MGRRKVMITERMKTAAKLYADELKKNGHIENKKALLKKAGYSETMSGESVQLERREGFKLLLEKHLPMSRLLEKHDEVLDAKNEVAKIRGLELGYRLHGVTLDRSANVSANFHFDASDVVFQDD